VDASGRGGAVGHSNYSDEDPELVKNANIAFWSLAEHIGQGGKGGLPDEVPMRLTLGYKPDVIQFESRVTSVKDGKEMVKCKNR
jgi:hypothetical protein